IHCEAPLSLSKDDGSTIYAPGGGGTYTLILSNAGPSTATGVTLTDTLPTGATLSAAATCTAQGSASCGTLSGAGGASSVSLSGATVPAGLANRLQLTIPVSYAATLTAATLTNTATADAAVSDPVSASDTNTRYNRAPVADAQSLSLEQGGSAAVTLSGSDADNDPLSFRVTTPPQHGSLSGTPPALTYTPASAFSGSDSFAYVANDSLLDSTPATVSITVTAANRAPTVTSTAITTATAGSAYRYDVEATDPDNDTLTYALIDPPSGASIDSGTGVIRWTPTTQQVGSHTFAVRVSDGHGGTGAQDFTLTVSNANHAPEITSTAITTASVGTPYSYDVDATDADNDTLTYTLSNPPSGMSIDTATGAISWTPAANQAGPHSVTILVSDGHGGSDEQSFSIDVGAANRPPAFTSTAPTQATRGEAWRYDAQASDPDGDVLAYDLDEAPAGMTVDAASGRLDWIPGDEQVGTHAVSLRVSDGRGGSAVQDFSVTVIAVNRPPRITSTPVVAGVAGTAYRYDVNATDPDNDALTYRLVDFPAGMSINATTGVIDWLPTDDQLAAADVTVQVQDAHGASDDQVFRVIVNADLVGHSHVGREFWFTHSLNSCDSNDLLACTPPHFPARSHWVTVAALNGAQGFVEIPGLNFRQDFTITAGGVAEIQLPWQVMNSQPAVARNLGVHVVSDEPVTVVALNRLLQSTDAAVIYPVDVLGLQYTAIDYPRYTLAGGQISVVAIHDNTTVSFTPPPGKAVLGPGGVVRNSWSVTLQRGQAYQLYSWEGQGGEPYSGARVISSRQVAVFGGGICANVPVEAKACDHLFEQLLPDRNLGQRFLAGRLATRSVGNVYRFVATEDDTAVYAGTQLVAVLRRGDVAERLLDGPVAIYATKPVQAWLLAAGETLDSGARDVPPDVPPHENDPDGNLLDPFAIGLPPVGTELSDYLFTTPQVPALLLHYAGLTIPESAVASLRLDGAAVSGVTWQPIPGTSSVHGNLRLAPGRHRLTAAAPFGLIVYGYGPYESYGYTGGLLIGNQDRVQRLEVTPLAQTRTVGDSACFAVVARDEQNKRIPYARFGVRVDGRLARAESGYLDGTGRGEYCFEHPFAEITPLVFESGFAQIQAQVEWLAPTDGVNRAPIITSLPALELRDAAFHYDLDAVDPNGDVLNYVLVSGPSGAQIDAQTGVLAWTPPVPANREPLLQDFTLRAVDPQGLHAEQRFTLQVHFTAQLSVVSKVNPDGSVSDNQSATEGFPYTSGLRALGGVAALLRVDLLQAPLAMTAELFDRQGSLKWSHDAVLSPALRYNDALHQGTRDNRSTAPDLVLAPVWRNSGSGMLVPVFGRPLDTNNDGVVNASDRLVAAAVAGSRLVARFVDTGEALPWSGTPQAYANIVPAFVDLDGDGRHELLYCNSASKLVAINGANQRIWNTDPVFGTNSFYPLFTSIEAADLDGDGTPEIFAAGRLYGANGVSRWNMGPSSGYVNTAYVSPLLIDIDGDGVREVLFYNEVRRANGSLAWTVPALSPSSPAVAEFAAFDFDGDGDKEVIASVLYTASNERRLERFNHDGTRLGNPIPLVSAGGPPAIFDIDRDGTADIYLPLERKAWSLDGSVRSALEPLSSANLPLLFDANGDGAVESLGPVDSSGDRFIRDVQTDWSWSQLKLGLTEQRGPGALVDSDGDGNAEWFVAGADNALARPVHGVWPADRAGRRSYRDGVARHAGSFDVDIPPRTPDDLRYDLWIGDLRQRAGGDAAHKRYEVNVRNRGLRGLQQPVTVRLYAGERGNGGHELTHKTIAPLRSGERAAAVFDDVRMDDLQGWIFAYVDAAANENGSDFLPYNNRVAAHVIDIVLSDGNSRVDRLLHSVEVRQRSLDLNINGNLPANVYSGHTITLQLLADQIDLDGSPYFFLTGAPEGARIDPWTGVLTWTPTAAQAGYRYFYANVRFPSGVHDIVMLTTTVVANPNRPPQITSTAPKYAVVGQAWNYAVAASDPDGDALTYALNPAAAGMSIDAQTGVISWTPATAGTQSATVRVTDSANNTTAQAFSVTVQTPATSIPVFSTSPPTTAKAGCLYTYDAEAANAGGQVMTYELFAGAPAGMTVNGATGLVQWTPAADQAGIRRVTVHVHNPGSTAFANQTWDIDVAGADRALRVDGLASPTYAAPNQPIALEAVVQYAAGSYMLTATVNGAPLALDAQGKASFTPPAAGAYTVVFNVADGCQSAQSSVTFYAGDATDMDPPLVQLHTPSNDSVITKPTAIVGTVNDAQLARWRLALKDSAGADQHRILATGTNTFSNAAFATLDPTLLMNGIHILVLEGTDTSGRVTTDSVAVSVEGDMKVGHYSVTFLELEIPLNGIPIRVTRTYDTRRAHEDLDFGYGWSIDYQNVRLRENRKLGYSWLLAQQSGGLAPWCVRPLSDPLVTVTLPDGKVEKFKARFEPECQQYTPTVYGELKFSPVGDTHSELKQLSYGTVRVVEQGESSNLVDLDALDQPLDPALYELTTEEGMVYVIDQQFGIRTITDQAGNTITYSRDGIIHSSGRRIGFERDAQDRIVRITQPDGEARTYTYSPAGDLLTAADPLGDASRYGYLASPRWPHYLETIHDPRNTRVARYEYDADGRLVASVDANDKRIEYT
ncbi:putative Ig domain-containing protein, partial [Tahibacter harae]